MSTRESIFMLVRARFDWRGARSLTQRAFLNAIARAIDSGARIVVGFAVNPLLLTGLGTQGFGLWQVLRQLVDYASPASGRPTQALQWTIAREQTSTDEEAKRRHVGSTLVLWFAFLPVLTVTGALLAWSAPGWLNAPPELARAARWAAGLLVANLVVMSLVEIPRAVLGGENLAYKRMGLSGALVLLGGLLTVLALHLDTGIVGVAACPLLTSLLTGLLFLRIVRRHVPWFGLVWPSAAAVRAFFQISWWFLVWRIVMQVMRASDLVILGMFASMEIVTAYALTKYVPHALLSTIATMVFSATPGLGGILGSGDVERSRLVRGELMSLVWLVATVLGTMVLLWNQSFVGLWVGAQQFAGSLPNLLIVVMSTQFVFVRCEGSIIDLTLDLRAKVILGLISTTLSLGAAALLVDRFELGVVGLCCGFIGGRVILSLAYPWLVGRILQAPLRAQLGAAWRPVAVATALFYVAFQLGSDIGAGSWLSLVPFVAVTLLFVTSAAFFGGLSARQRQRILRRLRRSPRSTL
jgi:O-antigen/teichoic acid export membrane protein